MTNGIRVTNILSSCFGIQTVLISLNSIEQILSIISLILGIIILAINVIFRIIDRIRDGEFDEEDAINTIEDLKEFKDDVDELIEKKGDKNK